MSTTTNQTATERLAVGAAELAKLLPISERHLWNLHRQGRLGPRAFPWSEPRPGGR